MNKITNNFWKDKKIFITGHTGFKGGWLSLWLSYLGAKVTGYSLAPNTVKNFYEKVNLKEHLEKSIIANILDYNLLKSSIINSKAEIVLHLAAQPLVKYSYLNPIETYQTNVMGTVHVLDAIRSCENVKAVVVVTSDKCYENKEWDWGYRENEPMGGYDPYSNSKGCSELVTSAYRQSYFNNKSKVGVSSARAGNVIGGGDWSEDRLIPDAIKAFEKNETLIIRHPEAQRPWQHVLEPISGYLKLAENLYLDKEKYVGAWNFGPNDSDAKIVKEVLEILIEKWNKEIVSKNKNSNQNHLAKWKHEKVEQLHEAHFLKLDISKAKNNLNWKPKWNLNTAIEKVVDWHFIERFGSSEELKKITLQQIIGYQEN